MRIRHILSLLLLAVAGSATFAADQDGVPKLTSAADSEPRAYVGEGIRISGGYDSKTKLRGEYYQVLQEDSAKALIGEGWVSGSAGGLKLSYQWLPQTELKSGSVRKLFLAVDQNTESDRKLTLGGGAEYSNWFWGAYLSGALTGRREVSSTTATTLENLPGVDNGRPFLQEIVTATTTRIFERPYDFGIGAMAGHFYEPALLRLYTRLDHEWGSGGARQDTLGIGVEKFFAESPVSVALNAEAYRKSGEVEPKQNDQRVNLVLRYEFGGKSYRPARESRLVPVAAATSTAVVEPASGAGTLQAAPRTPEKRMVKTTASLSADAFFRFDSVKITPEARASLDEVIGRLKANGHTGNIHLTGHTCNFGPVAYNQKLSERRALSIKEYLVSKGVAADSFVVEGKGKLEPRYPNNTKANRHKNRRVDMEFVSYVETVEEVPLPPVGGEAVPAKPDVKPAVPAAVEWKTEYIETEPAWLRRALHNTIRHKQTVDVYRQEEKTSVVTNGTRTFINRAPLAVDDAFQVAGNSSSNLLDVLKNDSDPDGDALRILTVQTPAHGTASISGNRVAYTPAPSYTGADSFTYTITDDKGGTATATVSVAISIANRPPVAVDDAFQVAGNSGNNLLDVLKNDSDPDGDALRILTVQTPAHGSAAISGNRVAYTPAPGYIGPDTFTYTVTDDKGGTATATATITASVVNRAPVAVDDAFQVAGNSSGNLLDVLKNDSDPDGDALRILSSLAQNPAHGTASINGNRVSYTPAPGYKGADSFAYTITDDKGGTATATASITVTPTNAAPVAADDAFQIVGNSSNNALDVLKNDSDPDGDPLHLVSVNAPLHGSATISGSSVSYTPAAGYAGADSFRYTVSDDKGLTASAAVNITVAAANHPPVAMDDFSWAIWGQLTSIKVLDNDSDPDGDPLTLVSVGKPEHGNAVIVGNVIQYTSIPTFMGQENFTYTISDGRGGTATATVRVTVIDP